MGNDFYWIIPTMERKKILMIAIGILVLIIILLVIGLKRDSGQRMATLEFWSVHDDKSAYSELIDAYQEQNKNITIKYKKIPFADYEKELINAFASGEGPDIFTIHHTWVPKHKSKISPMPQTENFLNPYTFQDIFVDVAYKDLVKEGEIYGLPLYVDTLALYYNKDYFNSAGITSPPTTWEQFLNDVETLTKRDKFGNIQQSGAAIGTARNINRSTDILCLLMFQTGAQMTNDSNTQTTFNRVIRSEGETFNSGKEALRFYTDFSNPSKQAYCWNRQMSYSIDAFYEGETAMMFNYAYHINTIKDKAPYLNFGLAPIPQIKNRNFDINYANYWANTVSKTSDNPVESWRFLMFLIQAQNNKKYLKNTNEVAARRDLIEQQQDDSELGVFAKQALSARSWYQIDNQAIEQILADMIESTVLGNASIEAIEAALNQAASQINVLMQK